MKNNINNNFYLYLCQLKIKVNKPTLKKEICTISLSKSSFDNDYTFYSDGTVIQLCDKYYTNTNIRTEHIAKELSPDIKKKLLEKCPIESIELIINLMSNK